MSWVAGSWALAKLYGWKIYDLVHLCEFDERRVYSHGMINMYYGEISYLAFYIYHDELNEKLRMRGSVSLYIIKMPSYKDNIEMGMPIPNNTVFILKQAWWYALLRCISM